jgi:hypothetical protein
MMARGGGLRHQDATFGAPAENRSKAGIQSADENKVRTTMLAAALLCNANRTFGEDNGSHSGLNN